MEVGYAVPVEKQEVTTNYNFLVVDAGVAAPPARTNKSGVCSLSSCIAVSFVLAVVFLVLRGGSSTSGTSSDSRQYNYTDSQTVSLAKLYGEPSCAALGPDQTEESARRFEMPKTNAELRDEATRQARAKNESCVRMHG